ncbi:MAG: alpha/beta hydrolase [Chloroflexota bacterium]
MMNDSVRIQTSTSATATSAEAKKPPTPQTESVKGFDLNFSQKVQTATLRTVCRLAPRTATSVSYFLFRRPRRKKLHYLSQFPSGAQRFALPYNKTKLVGYEWGTGSRTVLLIHGWEGQVGTMLGFVEPLLAAGYRVVALDGPGHGESGQLTTTVFDYAQAIELVCQHFGGFYGIVAHSFGGAATFFALEQANCRQPEKIVTVAPMTNLMVHVDIFQRLVGMTDDVLDSMMCRLEKDLNIQRDSWNMLAAAQKIQGKNLIWHDENDHIISMGDSHKLALHLNHAEIRKTAGLGHKRILKDPEVAQQTVAFLSQSD